MYVNTYCHVCFFVGKIRLLYEANPLALVLEEAGGAASSGVSRILDISLTVSVCMYVCMYTDDIKYTIKTLSLCMYVRMYISAFKILSLCIYVHNIAA